MKKTFFIISLTVLCLTNNFGQINSNLNQMESEEYVIYSTRLVGGKNRAYLNQNILIQTPKDIVEKIPNLSKETLKDFDNKNKSSALIEDKFSIRNRFILLDKAEFQKKIDLFIKEGINRSSNSPILVELSRIGFNESKTQALLYEFDYFGPIRCGNTIFSMFVLYEKKDGYWEIVGGYTNPSIN